MNMEPINTTREAEMLNRVERMLHIQNAAMHLEMMMRRAREIQVLLDQKQNEAPKADT